MRRLVAEAAARVPLRGALLAGSAGRGNADLYSDADLMLYVDAPPSEQTLREIVAAAGADGIELMAEPTDYAIRGDADFDGVLAEVVFVTIERVEQTLQKLLVDLDEVGSPAHRVLLGILDGLPLHGDELVAGWQERVREYPEPLRRAMIERHWQFFPLWYYDGWVGARDAELFRLDSLLDGAFNLLGVLAGLNRLYFSRFHLKRTRELVAQFERAPSDFGERLHSLFILEPAAAAAELGRLVDETRTLVREEFPDLELPLEEPVGERREPWRLPGEQ